MRGLLFLALLFLLFSSAFAAELVVPQKIPAGVAWSFSVSLDPSNAFTKTTVMIDGVEIASAFANSQVIIDPFNGGQAIKAFVVDTDPNSNAGMVLFVSHIGLSAGQHNVKVIAKNNDQVIDTKEKSVTVVEVLPSSFEDQFKEKIGRIDEKIGAVEAGATSKTNDAVQKIGTDIAAVSKENREAVDKLKNSFNAGIEKIEAQIIASRKLEEEFAGLRKNLVPQKETTQKKELPAIGFLSLGSVFSFNNVGFAILIALAAVVFIALLLKKRFWRGRSISLPEFDSAFEQISVPKDSSKENTAEILRMTSKGKWAHQEPKKKEEEP